MYKFLGFIQYIHMHETHIDVVIRRVPENIRNVNRSFLNIIPL